MENNLLIGFLMGNGSKALKYRKNGSNSEIKFRYLWDYNIIMQILKSFPINDGIIDLDSPEDWNKYSEKCRTLSHEEGNLLWEKQKACEHKNMRRNITASFICYDKVEEDTIERILLWHNCQDCKALFSTEHYLR